MYGGIQISSDGKTLNIIVPAGQVADILIRIEQEGFEQRMRYNE